MLNQVAVEALYSATYVETYLDSVENLPDDVQRYLSRIREIDVQYRAYLRDVDIQYEQCTNYSTNDQENSNNSKRSRAMTRIQQSLIAAQELGDEKLQIVTQLQELIDHKTRQLEYDFKNLDYGKDEPMLELKEVRAPSPPLILSPNPINIVPPVLPVVVTSPSIVPPVPPIILTSIVERVATVSTVPNTSSAERTSKRARRTRTDTVSTATTPTSAEIVSSEINLSVEVQAKPLATQSNNSVQKKTSTASSTGKKKKRKTRGAQNNTNQTASRETRDDTPPIEEPIDPDEPTYCLCDQISFGEMILCDNDLCPIEWFHFSCVSLMSKPKGKWFCPNCRGDRPNIMKPKAQFLKELERYNKEKEEKT